jgi:cysteine-rich repeat protein
MFGSSMALRAHAWVAFVLLSGCTVLVNNTLSEKGAIRAEACVSDEACGDGNPCNGEERCDPTAVDADMQGCVVGTPLQDEQVCDSDGNASTVEICKNGLCSRSCTTAEECDDGDACNGVESCDVTAERCVLVSKPLDALAECQLPTGGRGTCSARRCTLLSCGNGVVDEGEACDDGNSAQGDGCDNDCVFSCGTPARDCRNDDVCTNRFECEVQTHKCIAKGPLDCSGIARPNPCTAVLCVKEVKDCAYVPMVYVNTDSSPAVIDVNVALAWIRDYPYSGDCNNDPVCVSGLGEIDKKNYGDLGPGYGFHRSFGYCQRYGPVSSPSCYNSFDYDCNGALAFEQPAVFECNADARTCVNGYPGSRLCGASVGVRVCLPTAQDPCAYTTLSPPDTMKCN